MASVALSVERERRVFHNALNLFFQNHFRVYLPSQEFLFLHRKWKWKDNDYANPVFANKQK